MKKYTPHLRLVHSSGKPAIERRPSFATLTTADPSYIAYCINSDHSRRMRGLSELTGKQLMAAFCKRFMRQPQRVPQLRLVVA